MGNGPLLSITAPTEGCDGTVVYTGGSDGTIARFDVGASTMDVIGRHSKVASSSLSPPAVSCLSYLSNNLIASAGWDKTLHIWDVRVDAAAGGRKAGGGETKRNKPVAMVDLPGKAFGMDASADRKTVVVATSGRRNCFYDVRKLPSSSMSSKVDPVDDDDDGQYVDDVVIQLLMDRESSLKYQTRCIQFFGTSTSTHGVAVGSIEGRVAIEYMDDMGVQCPLGSKKYAFKCHRVNDTVYPVNAIAFHPIHGTFATGGADGTVVMWDAANKKKLSSIAKCPTSIAALAFNGDGTRLAIASSYTFEEGERDHPREEIYVQDVLDCEVRPKTKK